ncbi:DUF927 domain-containing protein [Cohaesibacter intestini]|uniref:DUF927 domain-containing protein n=1 Tax=Cohaesibacter intestini TaxID=2211145 RepID=UPI000DEB2957|nr:DUF927 domain-containing protein [Cohaesibacter intestini]
MEMTLPEFLPTKFEGPSETKSKAAMLRRKYRSAKIKRKRCSPRNRCRRDGCPICLRDFRMGLVEACTKLRLHEKAGEWIFLTLYPSEAPIPQGKLSQFDLITFKEKHYRRLQRAMPEALLIGGADFALKIENGKVIGWLPHLHLLLFGISKEESLKRLRQVYRKSKHALKPVDHRQVQNTAEDFFRVLTYCYKSAFFQKLDKRLSQSGDKKVRPFLTDDQDFELRSYLNRYQVDGRLIQINCKKQRTTDKAKIDLALGSPYDDIFRGLSSGFTLDEDGEGHNCTHRPFYKLDRGKVGIGIGYTMALTCKLSLSPQAFQPFNIAETSGTVVTDPLSHMSHLSRHFLQNIAHPTTTDLELEEFTMINHEIISYRLQHKASKEHFVLVKAPVSDRSRTASILLDAGDFHSPSKLRQELLKAGVSDKGIDTSSIQNGLPENAGTLTDTAAWVKHGDVSYFPFYQKELELDDLTILYQNASLEKYGLAEIKGSAEEWETQVGNIAAYRFLPMVSILLGIFATLRPSNGEHPSVIVHFSGGAASERKLLTSLCASIRGNPDKRPSWSMDPADLAEAVKTHGQVAICMGDIDRYHDYDKSEKKTISENIKALTGLRLPASSKAAKVGLTAIDTPYLICSSGSQDLSYFLNAGGNNRWDGDALVFNIDLPTEEEGGIWSQGRSMFSNRMGDPRDAAKKVSASLRNSFGAIGEKWDQYVCEDPDGLSSDFATKVEQSLDFEEVETPFDESLMRFVAELRATGYMLQDADFIPFAPGLVHFACQYARASIIANGPPRPVKVELLAKSLYQAMADKEQFPRRPKANVHGFDKPGYVKLGIWKAYIRHEAFENLVLGLVIDETLNPENEKQRLLAELEAKGVFIRANDGGLTTSVRPGKGIDTVRMLVFDWAKLKTLAGVKSSSKKRKQPPKPSSTGRKRNKTTLSTKAKAPRSERQTQAS